MQNDSDGRVILSGALAKLPRIRVTARPAKNEREAQLPDLVFGVTTSKQISEAFDVKRHVVSRKS
jgi:hypothetical protein